MLTRKPLGSLVFLPLGAASAIVGLLPWLITGMRLPLQNLWASQSAPADMPIVLLPFSQYTAPLVVALLLVGAAIAGIVGRAEPARHPGRALLALMAGVLIVQVIAIVQTAVTVTRGLEHSTAAKYYLAALLGGAVVSALLGMALLALIAGAPKADALIGLSVAAIAVSSWVSGLVFPINVVTTASPLTSVLSEVIRYLPAILIGAAIAWCGIATAGRVIAAIASLLLLWLGPTLVTAVSAAIGTRVLARYPGEMLDYGVQVFRSAIVLPEFWLTPLALAVVVAAVGLVGRRTIHKRSSAVPHTSNVP